jgi:short-subunit dehydrogenase
MYVCVSSLFLTIWKQHSGKIIKISSIAGIFGEPHGAWYHASKFVFERLSDSLRMDLKQFGLEVVVIN